MHLLGGSGFFFLVYCVLFLIFIRKPAIAVTLSVVIALASALISVSEIAGRDGSFFLDGGIVGGVVFIAVGLVFFKKTGI